MNPPVVKLELVANDNTTLVGSVSADEPCGSISSDAHDDQPRRLFLFGWQDDKCGVWESLRGFDVANSAVRAVSSVELKLLSDLAEPYELTIYRLGVLVAVRFTAIAEEIA